MDARPAAATACASVAVLKSTQPGLAIVVILILSAFSYIAQWHLYPCQRVVAVGSINNLYAGIYYLTDMYTVLSLRLNLPPDSTSIWHYTLWLLKHALFNLPGNSLHSRHFPRKNLTTQISSTLLAFPTLRVLCSSTSQQQLRH